MQHHHHQTSTSWKWAKREDEWKKQNRKRRGQRDEDERRSQKQKRIFVKRNEIPYLYIISGTRSRCLRKRKMRTVQTNENSVARNAPKRTQKSMEISWFSCFVPFLGRWFTFLDHYRQQISVFSFNFCRYCSGSELTMASMDMPCIESISSILLLLLLLFRRSDRLVCCVVLCQDINIKLLPFLTRCVCVCVCALCAEIQKFSTSNRFGVIFPHRPSCTTLCFCQNNQPSFRNCHCCCCCLLRLEGFK